MFLREVDAVIFVARGNLQLSFKKVFEQWMPQLKQLLTIYSRAGVPQVVLKHAYDEELDEEGIENYRAELELVKGSEGVEEMIEELYTRRTLSMAYPVEQKIKAK